MPAKKRKRIRPSRKAPPTAAPVTVAAQPVMEPVFPLVFEITKRLKAIADEWKAIERLAIEQIKRLGQ